MPALHNVTDSGYCRHCGHDFVRRASRVGWRGGIDLRAVAKYQRRLLTLILALLGTTALVIAVPLVAPLGSGAASRGGQTIVAMLPAVVWIISLGGSIAALIVMTQLMVAMRFGMIMTGLHCVLALAPCLNILVLLSVSSQASQTLRAGGLKVGVLGVSDEQVVRMLSPNRCRSCGYILMETALGQRCPECGAEVTLDD